MDLQELIAEMERKQQEMDTLLQKRDAAKEDEKAGIEALLEQTKNEFDALSEKVEVEKAKLERQKGIDEAKKLLQVDDKGVKLAGPGDGKEHATAVDHDRREEAKVAAFLKYAHGKRQLERISGEEWDLLKPVGAWTQAPADAVDVPKRFVAAMFGEKFCAMSGNPEIKKWGQILFGKQIPIISTSATGAAVIPQDFRAMLLQVPAEEPHVLGLATVIPAPTGTVTYPRLVQTDANEYGGVVVTEIGEGEEKPEADFDIEQIQIATHETAAYTEIGHNLLNRSAIDLEALLRQLFGDAMRAHIDNRAMTGTGVGQMLGIVNTAGIRLVARAAAGAVGYVDLVNLEHAVRAYHRAGAIWTAHDTVIQALKLLVDTTNRPLWIPNAQSGLSAGQPGTILGRSYIDTYRLNTLGNSGDIAFGNWRWYFLAMEENVTMAASDHYRFRHNVRAYKVWSKVGGRLVEPRTFSILGEEAS